MKNRIISGFLCLSACFLLLALPSYSQESTTIWHNPDTDNFYEIQQKANAYFEGKDKGRGSGYKQFKRWEYLMEPRVYPSGKLVNPTKRAWDEDHRYRGQSHKKTTSHSGEWTSLGIKNYTRTTGWNGGMGRVNCIAFHPTDANTIFVGTPAGGLWKSSNGGTSWTSLTDGLPIIGVSGIAIDYNNPSIIYILTGDGDGGHTNSIGVLKSTNGGQTWLSTGLIWKNTNNVRGYKLLMHPGNSDILFAISTGGIHKTIDGGVSWTFVQSGWFRDIKFKPGTPTTMYAATSTTFFKSINTGDIWTSTATGLPTSGSNRIAIGVSAANNNYVYLLYGSSSGFAGLYRSTNSGTSFSIRSNSPNILGYEVSSPFDTKSQSSYDLAIAIAPNNINEVHIGGINCWKSTNGGSSWSYTSFWNEKNVLSASGKYTHADIHALEFNEGKLHCGSDGGIYCSANNAASWFDLSSGLVITQHYRLGGTPSTSNIIYSGTQDNGCNGWTGTSTMDHVRGGDGMECIIDHSSSNRIYTCSQNGAIVRSDDGGATWSSAEPSGAGSGAWVTPYIMHPGNSKILYAGYTDVWRTKNKGKDWNALNTGSSNTHIALAMGTSDPDVLYAAERVSGSDILRHSDDEGDSWTTITSGLPVSSAKITYIAVHPSNANKAWVTFSGYTSGEKVYETTNGGASWVNRSGSLPNVPVNCIAAQGGDNDGLYIGTDVGVFYRNDDIGDWIPFRNGLPNVIVNELEIHLSSGKIRAATFGRGLWESELYRSCPNSYTLSGSNIKGYYFYEAGSYIESSSEIVGGIGTQVEYKAGDYIDLTTGFEVKTGSSFNGEITPCDGSFTFHKLSGTYEGPMQGVIEEVSPSGNAENRMTIYPNPFSQRTNIEFEVINNEKTKLIVTNMLGKEVQVLMDKETLEPGSYKVAFDASGLPSGVYFCTLTSGKHKQTKKIVLSQ